MPTILTVFLSMNRDRKGELLARGHTIRKGGRNNGIPRLRPAQAERIRLPHAAGREVPAAQDRRLHRRGRPEAAIRQSSWSAPTGGGPARRSSRLREDDAWHGVRGRASG